MKYNIAILAGGLGSRLKNTEILPKPLVSINGLSLISRIIISLNKTDLFSCFHILTCCDEGLFKKVLNKEISTIKYAIHNEVNRSGRIGAIQNFLESEIDIKDFFVCNGDTIFNKLIASEIKEPIKALNPKPITYLAMPDPSRDDYKSIFFGDKDKRVEYQNSGLFFMNRDWFNKSIMKNPGFKDIDDHLFQKESSKVSLLSTTLLDAGTPERLSHIRSSIN